MSFRKVSVLFVAAMAVLMPSIASAQTTGWGVGVKAGVNSSTVSISEDVEFPEPKRLIGLTGGLFITREINTNVGLQIEGLFSQRGAKFEQGSDSAEIKINYIDVPVLFTAGSTMANGTRLHVLGGATASAKLNTKFTVNDVEQSDEGDDTETFDLGLTVGAGVMVKKVAIDARYTHGLMDISKDEEGTIKNRSFSVTLGIRFK